MEILKLNRKNFGQIIKKAVQYIKGGRILVLPTDTIYGLVCDARDKKAVEKIFKIKKRPKEKPIPLFVKDLKAAKKIARIDKKQERFLKSNWPGSMTAVLERKGKIKIFGVDKKTVALRIPKHKLINKILEKLDCPLAETSINISNKPPIIQIKKIIRHFKNKKLKPGLIIDAGNSPQNKPSTVIDLTGRQIKILRR